MDSALLLNTLNWSYKKLSSIKTSLYILGALSFLYVIGTIFPQGGDLEEYIAAGGKLVFFVKIFSLLRLFTSPIFLVAALTLSLNLFICTIERYPTLFQRRKPAQRYVPSQSLYLTQGLTQAYSDTRKILSEGLGFKVVSKDAEWISMEKGPILSYRALTWLYHAGMALCLIGLLLTYLFAYEDTLTLSPGKATPVETKEIGRLLKPFGISPKPGFSLLLDSFSTEHVQSPRLKYPKEKPSRLAIGLGWQGLTHEMNDESLFTKDWRSGIKVIKGGMAVKEKGIEINDPLKYGGYTFYQAGFSQTVKIRVNDNPLPLSVNLEDELAVPGLDAPIRFKELKTGTVERPNGSIETLTPYTIVRQPATGADGKKKYIDAGRLELGSPVVIDGVRLTLVDFEEGSVLSYRFDPGFPILWWAGIFVLVTMTIRFFGAWYFISYNITESGNIVCLDLYVEAKGIPADCEGLLMKVEHMLTRGDIKPDPVHPLQ